VKVIHLCNAS